MENEFFHGLGLSWDDVLLEADSTSLLNWPTKGSGSETSLDVVPSPSMRATEGLSVLNLSAAGEFFSLRKSWSDLRLCAFRIIYAILAGLFHAKSDFLAGFV